MPAVLSEQSERFCGGADMQCVLGDSFNRGFHVALHLFLYGIVCFLNGSGDPFRKPIDWVSYDLNVPRTFKSTFLVLG